MNIKKKFKNVLNDMVERDVFKGKDKSLVKRLLLEKETKEVLYYLVCICCNGNYVIDDEFLEYREQLSEKVSIEKVYDLNVISCINLKKLNKYNLYNYVITDTELKDKLWSYKDSCLKYVEEKDGELIISLAREHIFNFIEMLKENDIKFDEEDIKDYILPKSKDNLEKVEMVSFENLPFKPFDYQVEDIKYLLTKRRAIIGHEMGCISGDAVLQLMQGVHRLKLRFIDLFNEFRLGNIDYKVLSLVNEEYKYMPINNVIYSGRKQTKKVMLEYDEIVCTNDHLVLTDVGWKRVDRLVKGNKVITLYGALIEKQAVQDTYTIDGVYRYRYQKVIDIEDSGEIDVFDLSIADTKIRNFVCNDIIVHNCGKTMIASVVGESLKNKKKLVICPETLRLNWEREIRLINPDADIEVVKSSDDFKGIEKDWTIMGYRTLVKFEKYIQTDVMIIDEAHFIKGVNNYGRPTSSRASAVLNLAENTEYVYALTGTPVPSKNKDVFNLLKLVKSDYFDFNTKNTFYKFANRYCDPVDNGFGVTYNGNTNSNELHKILKSDMIRRLKKDVLPHLTKQRIFLPIKPRLSKEYKEIEKQLSEGEGTYLALAMTGRKHLANLKIETAKDLARTILDNDESVVIVTNYIETADKLKKLFKSECCEIRGGMTDKQKQKSVDDFQSGKKRVCILNMVAGGVGVTLTKAKYMIMLDYDWIPANNIQTEDRICRTGQTNQCTIYYIYCENSIFDRIFVKMLSHKSENIAKVVDKEENQFNLEQERVNNFAYLSYLKEELKERENANKR